MHGCGLAHSFAWMGLTNTDTMLKYLWRSAGMIVSFADKGTQDLYDGTNSKDARRIPANLQAAAFRKLVVLNNAQDLRDLQAPRSNCLLALKDDLKGKYSIRINGQWRIVFKWENGNAASVAIMDYH